MTHCLWKKSGSLGEQEKLPSLMSKAMAEHLAGAWTGSLGIQAHDQIILYLRMPTAALWVPKSVPMCPAGPSSYLSSARQHSMTGPCLSREGNRTIREGVVRTIAGTNTTPSQDATCSSIHY